MRKNVIIAILGIALLIAITSGRQMTDRTVYWMQRCDAAESVINRVESDNPDYVLDVLCEGDEWSDWMKYNPK